MVRSEVKDGGREMSVIFEGVDMPTACCFVDGEHFEYCEFYNICKKRDTIKTNCKPSDCPVKALEQDPTSKNDLEVDAISRQTVIDELKRYFHDEYYQRTSIQDCRDCFIEDVLNHLPSVTPQEPRIDFEELKSKILSEVDGSTDDAWFAYGEVCNRISNSIDEYVQNIKAMPSVTPPLCADCNFKMDEVRRAYDKVVTEGHVLDKIRAEIEQGYCKANSDYDRGRNYGLYMATQIIDKYKTEK